MNRKGITRAELTIIVIGALLLALWVGYLLAARSAKAFNYSIDPLPEGTVYSDTVDTKLGQVFANTSELRQKFYVVTTLDADLNNETVLSAVWAMVNADIVPTIDATYSIGQNTTPLRFLDQHLSGDFYLGDDLLFQGATSRIVGVTGTPVSIIAGDNGKDAGENLQLIGVNIELYNDDPGIWFNTETAGDTDFWIAVDEDSLGTDNDTLEIGVGPLKLTGTAITLHATGATTFAQTATFQGKVQLDDGVGDSPALEFVDASDHYLHIDKLDAGSATIYNNEGAINIQLSGDIDDYLTLLTAASVPQIGTVGACDLKITADSGAINFDNENLTTTGNMNAATYGSDSSITDVELRTLDDGATTQILVGGGAGSAPVWGTDLPTATTVGAAYIYRVGGTDVANADCVDDLTIASTSLISGTLGLTITGAVASLNASSNFATNINTGTSTGAISLGGGSGTFAVASTGLDISALGAIANATTIDASGKVTATGGYDYSSPAIKLNNVVSSPSNTTVLTAEAVSDVDWTDIDVTAVTSSRATMLKAFCIFLDTGGIGWLKVRQNGLVGGFQEYIFRGNATGHYATGGLDIPLDAGQIFEYKIDASGVGTGYAYILLIGWVDGTY